MMRRLFLALWPDVASRNQLQQISAQLNSDVVRLVPPYNLHVTLVFIGSVDEGLLSAIDQASDKIQGDAFTLQFDRLEYWPKPKILCLTASHVPKVLAGLVNALTMKVNELGVVTDHRNYQPHITLARHVKSHQSLEFEPFLWHAGSFSLVESLSTVNGVIYKVRSSWHFS